MGGRPVSLYNLDVVISVGYRVKSIEGTRFRQWATQEPPRRRIGFCASPDDAPAKPYARA